MPDKQKRKHQKYHILSPFLTRNKTAKATLILQGIFSVLHTDYCDLEIMSSHKSWCEKKQLFLLIQ